MATKIPDINSQNLLDLVPENRRSRLAKKLMKLHDMMGKMMKERRKVKKSKRG